MADGISMDTSGGTLSSLHDGILNCINSMLGRYENNQLSISMDEFAEMYLLFQDINIDRINDKDKYEYVGGLLYFLNDKDIDDKYLPEKPDDWEQYLKVLDLDEVLGMSLKSTLAGIPIEPDEIIPSESTIVTMYYDITKITRKTQNRYGEKKQIDYFKKKSEALLKIDQCMYIFCDPDLIEYVADVRDKCGLSKKTVIYPFDLKESPYYLLKPLIKHCFIQNRHANLVSNGNERIFHNVILPLVWTKIKAVEMASDENAFSSKTFVWVDFGIFKINNDVHTSEELQKVVDGLSQEAIVIPYICNTSPREIEDRGKFYRENRWKMIGGIFSIPGHIVKDFIAAWTTELKLNLESGYPAQEEQILACVKAENPQLFNCYQADYKDIIANRFKMQTAHYLIMQNLQHNIALGHHMGVAEISPFLLKDINMENGRYGVDQILQIYNEILIGCWYLEDKRHLSREAAEKMKGLLNISTLPEGTKHGMISNMQFHKIAPE